MTISENTLCRYVCLQHKKFVPWILLISDTKCGSKKSPKRDKSAQGSLHPEAPISFKGKASKLLWLSISERRIPLGLQRREIPYIEEHRYSAARNSEILGFHFSYVCSCMPFDYFWRQQNQNLVKNQTNTKQYTTKQNINSVWFLHKTINCSRASPKPSSRSAQKTSSQTAVTSAQAQILSWHLRLPQAASALGLGHGEGEQQLSAGTAPGSVTGVCLSVCLTSCHRVAQS